MTAPMTIPATVRSARKDDIDEAELAAASFLAATAVELWRPTGMTCGRSSDGLPTKSS